MECTSSTDRVTLFKRNYHLVRQKNPCCTANTKQQAKPLKRDQIISFDRELAHGPLYKWTEHSNFPLQGRGDSKTPIL